MFHKENIFPHFNFIALYKFVYFRQTFFKYNILSLLLKQNDISLLKIEFKIEKHKEDRNRFVWFLGNLCWRALPLSISPRKWTHFFPDWIQFLPSRLAWWQLWRFAVFLQRHLIHTKPQFILVQGRQLCKYGKFVEVPAYVCIDVCFLVCRTVPHTIYCVLLTFWHHYFTSQFRMFKYKI